MIQQDTDKKFIHGFPGSRLHRFKKRNLRKSPASRSPAKAAAQSGICSAPFAADTAAATAFSSLTSSMRSLFCVYI